MEAAWHAGVGALLVLLLVASGASANSQTWYLEEKEHPTIQDGVREMVRGAPNDADGTVTVDAGTCQTWASSESALVDVAYDENGWTGNFDVQDGTVDTGLDYDAHLGYSDHTGDTVDAVDGRVFFTEHDATIDSGSIDIAHPDSAEDATFQVPDDRYLIYRFCVPSGEPDATVLTDGQATLNSPAGSPSYPTPELGVLPLTAAGLLGLLVVGHRRWQDDA